MVNKVVRSLEGAYAPEGSEKEDHSAVQRCVSLDTQKQWSELA